MTAEEVQITSASTATSLVKTCVAVSKDETHLAAETLAAAFVDDPVTSYFLEFVSDKRGKKDRARFLLFLATANLGISFGGTHATSATNATSPMPAACMWLPPGVEPSDLQWARAGILRCMLASGIRSSWRILWYSMMVDKKRKKHLGSRRHYDLMVIGVKPEEQGKGFAGPLLRELAARADAENVPCWLESSKQRNVPIYEHYGFKVVEVVKVGPHDLFCMIREPAGGSL